MPHDTVLECSEYEFYSAINQICVQCAPFCRLYPLECSKTPECEKFRADFDASPVPLWATALIVIVVVLILCAIGLLLAIRYRKRLGRLCKFSCMFSHFTKKKKSARSREDDKVYRVPYATKSTWSPEPVKSLAVPYDLEAIKRRTVMERFFASIEQHPPRFGVDEMEPLSNELPARAEPHRQSARSHDNSRHSSSVGDTDSQRRAKLKERLMEKAPSDEHSDRTDSNEALDLIDRQRAPANFQMPKPLRKTLDNRDILETYHFSKVSTKSDSSRHVGQKGHHQGGSDKGRTRPVQLGRRTGLNWLRNPVIGASAQTQV